MSYTNLTNISEEALNVRLDQAKNNLKYLLGINVEKILSGKDKDQDFLSWLATERESALRAINRVESEFARRFWESLKGESS